MAATAPYEPETLARPQPHYLVEEVCELTRLAAPTVYMLARKDPERWGRVQYGRSVRFRRESIDRLVREGA